MMSASRILQFALMVLVCTVFGGTLAFLMNYPVPKENEEVVKAIAYQVTGAFIAVVNFAFGSSTSSQRKDELRTAKL